VDADAVRRRLGDLGSRAHAPLPTELVPSGWRRSAVLILLWEAGGTVRFALARRGHALRTQPGTVALPGGVVDDGEDPADTALREAEEELGVARDAITVLGRLDDHWTVAQFAVAPFVGWHDGSPTFRPSADEVAEVLTVTVDDLLDPAHHHTYRVPLGEIDYEDDILVFGPHRIAGMTADILVDLRDWLRGVDRRRLPARAAALAAYTGD
jgi:8-oxo-dGTP pyrophosphatase MutT (NUDIX family)